MKTLESHELAELFPMGKDAELKVLAEDIKNSSGLLEPITTYQGKILDGRRRLKACEIAKIEPRYKEWDGECGSLLQFVVAKNLHRRHLSTAERVILAVEVEKLIKIEAKKRQESTQAKPGQKVGAKKGAAAQGAGPESHTPKGRARDQAGETMDVSGKSVDRAKKVMEKGTPELQKAMKESKIPISQAAKFADMSPEEQKEAVRRAQDKPKRTGVNKITIEEKTQRSFDKAVRNALDSGWKDKRMHAYLDERIAVVRAARKERPGR